MKSAVIAVVSIACIFGGSLIGFALRKLLPADHLSAESRDAVKVGAGMISMMAALVLGLLVSSAKQTFDSTNAAIVKGGAQIILLDRVLGSYGPEASDLRDHLRRGLEASIELLWPEERRSDAMAVFERAREMELLAHEVRQLEPKNPLQHALQAQAQGICNDLLMSRWVQIEQGQTTLPIPFVVIMLFWLTVLYASFGLLAPGNGTVLTVMLVGAISIATALFLILEMNRPMAGTIRASGAPMRKALELLDR